MWHRYLLLSVVVGVCWGHGRLIDPPSRASAWRYEWDTPKDYNDNEGNCGGFFHQHYSHGGKCGICGDAWEEDPRPHEVGGKYATGTIVEEYLEGQVITVKVELTALHKGHFEFRICPYNNNLDVEATLTCLDDHRLSLVDGSRYRHYLPDHTGIHSVQLQLPEGLTCVHCVFQWRYVAGNNWGRCPDFSYQPGCGPQEEFRACADVAISSQPTPRILPMQTTTAESIMRTSTAEPTMRTSTAEPTMRTTTAEPTSSCHPVGYWMSVPGMNDWCMTNCHHVPPYCPASHCTCD